MTALTREKKIQLLQALNEKDLRELVLIPLLSKMGFIDPILHHHSNEKGKDIVCKELDAKFKKVNYIAVIVKSGDVTGSSSGSSSYFALANQIKQSFNEPYRHIYDLKEVYVDGCMIIISGRFLPTSLDSIYNTLKSERLDKLIRHAIDINKLQDLVDEYFKEYWVEAENGFEVLTRQRNFLLNNLTKLLNVIIDKENVRTELLRKILNADLEIDVDHYQKISKYIVDIGFGRINIDRIEEFYSDMTIPNFYCDIKKEVSNIKKNAQSILFDLEEPIEILKNILVEIDPTKIVKLSDELGAHIGSSGNICTSARDIYRQEDFARALEEYRRKKEILDNHGLVDFYHKCVDQILKKAERELATFYERYPKNKNNIWLGMRISFDVAKKEIHGLEFYVFEDEPKKVKDSFSGYERETKRLTLKENNEIVVEYCVNCYGFIKEDMSNEAKAKDFKDSYQRSFAEKFFEIFGISND